MVEMERKMNEDEEIRGVRVGWSAPARRTAALGYTLAGAAGEASRARSKAGKIHQVKLGQHGNKTSLDWIYFLCIVIALQHGTIVDEVRSDY